MNDYVSNIQERLKELGSSDIVEKYLAEIRRFVPLAEVNMIREHGLDQAAIANAIEIMTEKSKLIQSGDRQRNVFKPAMRL